MSQPLAAARRPAAPAPAIGRVVHANRSTAELYEDAIRAGEGMVAADGPLVVRTGKHTGRSPKDKFVVREPSSEARSGGARSTSRSARSTTTGSGPGSSSTSPSGRCSPRTATSARTRITAARCASTPRPRGPASSPGTCSAGRPARTSPPSGRTSRSSTCRRSRPIPATEGTRSETAILRPSQADGGDHRRHRVRRRDQEVGLHGHELPAARRGRAADALGGQRRRGARLRRVLRAVGDRQDDALRRSRSGA